MSTCKFVPFPGNGAYGHWYCQRKKWHLGPHRFVNYTIARFPRVWRLPKLWRRCKSIESLRKHYRSALYPTKYEPVGR